MRLIPVLALCVALIIGCSLISAGWQSITECQIYPEPSVMTYGKFAQDRPLSGWVDIKGGFVNIADGAYLHVNVQNPEDLARSRTRNRADPKPATELLLPVYPSKDYNIPAIAIVRTHDAAILKKINALRSLLRTGTDVEIEAWIAENSDRLWFEKELKGMIRPGADLDPTSYTLLRGSLDPRFVIVEEGREPSMASGTGQVCAGLAIFSLIGLAWYLSKKRGATRQQHFLDEEYD